MSLDVIDFFFIFARYFLKKKWIMKKNETNMSSLACPYNQQRLCPMASLKSCMYDFPCEEKPDTIIKNGLLCQKI